MTALRQLTRFETATYTLVAVLLASLYLIELLDVRQSVLPDDLLAPDGKLATVLSIGVPVLAFTGTMLAFYLRPPMPTYRRIAPPIRLVSETTASKLAFVAFWVAVVGLGLVRILIVPNIGHGV